MHQNNNTFKGMAHLNICFSGLTYRIGVTDSQWKKQKWLISTLLLSETQRGYNWVSIVSVVAASEKYPEYVVNKHTACGINILFNDHKVLTFIELRMSGSLFTDPSFHSNWRQDSLYSMKTRQACSSHSSTYLSNQI